MINGINISRFLEYTSLILALIYYKKYASSAMKYLIIYLCLICFVETFKTTLNTYYPDRNWGSFNVYNIYTFFEFNIIFLIYYKLTYEKKTHTIIKYITIIFNIIYLFSFLFTTLQLYTVPFGSLVVSLVFLLYLREFLNSDAIQNYKKSVFFWVTCGLLIYYLGTAPLQSVLIYYKDSNLFSIQHYLTIVAHICIVIGLLTGQRINQKK